MELGVFTVDVTLQDNGLYDVYLAHEGNSGEHYTDVTGDRIAILLVDDIECVRESYEQTTEK